jgi:hypothetical protein
MLFLRDFKTNAPQMRADTRHSLSASFYCVRATMAAKYPDGQADRSGNASAATELAQGESPAVHESRHS